METTIDELPSRKYTQAETWLNYVIITWYCIWVLVIPPSLGNYITSRCMYIYCIYIYCFMDRLAYIYIYIPFISIFIYWIYESLYINLYIHRMEIFHNLDGCDHAIHLDSPGFIMEIWDLQLLIQIIFQLIVNPTSSESRYYSEIHYDGIRSILTNYIHIYIYIILVGFTII
jgi:hypothetical protein